MARIQILELPMNHLGENSQTPFALVIDQVETEDTMAFDQTVVVTMAALTQTDADEMAVRIGAVGAILTACTLEVTP